LPFPSGFFTSASALDVLEHVPDENDLLAEIRRVLAPGGALIVTAPRRHIFSFLDPGQREVPVPADSSRRLLVALRS
jgi:ubiquinone/menaquinone biosynthesis C-methylase UbiE